MVRDRDGVSYQMATLAVDDGGRLAVAAPDSPGAAVSPRVGVNREFLLQAVAATGRDQLVLDLDWPYTPLAVRVPGDESTLSILMPVRLS